MSYGTFGNFARVFCNGEEWTADSQDIGFTPGMALNPTLAQNVGVHGMAPGGFDPRVTLKGYMSHGIKSRKPHDLLRLGQDIDYIFAAVLGYRQAPQVGDWTAFVKATLLAYNFPKDRRTPLSFDAQFSGRGSRPCRGKLLYLSSETANVTGTPVDFGPACVANNKGAVAGYMVLTPTGVAATGSISASGVISDGDTFTINAGSAQVYTFKTVMASAGHVQIGATYIDSMRNLWAALVGALDGAGSQYYAGTVPLSANIIPSAPAAGVIALTAAATGTGGNAYTLAKTGVNLAVSGATMSGGVAGETITSGAIQTSTASGGSYAAAVATTLTGTARGGEIVELAPGTQYERWAKFVMTRSANTQLLEMLVAWAPVYNL